MKNKSPIGKLVSYIVLSAIVFFGAVTHAHAYDGTVGGKVGQIDVTDNGNFGVRIYLAGFPTMCTGGGIFAYLNNTDSNFNVYIANLLTAKVTSSPVTIQSYTVGGQCHISYVAVGT